MESYDACALVPYGCKHCEFLSLQNSLRYHAREFSKLWIYPDSQSMSLTWDWMGGPKPYLRRASCSAPSTLARDRIFRVFRVVANICWAVEDSGVSFDQLSIEHLQFKWERKPQVFWFYLHNLTRFAGAYQASSLNPPSLMQLLNLVLRLPKRHSMRCRMRCWMRVPL